MSAQNRPLPHSSPKSTKKKPLLYFDTAKEDRENARSFLFQEPLHIIVTYDYGAISEKLEELSTYAEKYWCAGFLSYEVAYGLEEKLFPLRPQRTKHDMPLVWFGVFKKPREVKTFPLSDTECAHAQKKNITHAVSEKAYKQKICTIKRWIGKGHTYQVNYTFDCFLRTRASAPALYQELRAHQPTPYCAYLDTGEAQILSFSPELFFVRQGRHIHVKPMKGTAPRGRWDSEDRTARIRLAQDIKNRSENIMIVDLLRNDLGRVCVPGSIHPTALFSTEKHETLYQMTSTIRGTLRKGVSYADIFKSIFPSGSVTGAPKVRTMEIIHALEKGRRNVYCGAIGFISPQGEAVFNVPIRTVYRRKRDTRWTYRVGSGIVWDSEARHEWEECKTKHAFLMRKDKPSFELFETILWDNGWRYYRDHLQRMRRSAHFFNYPFSHTESELLRKKMERVLTKKKTAQKVRIFINKNGTMHWDTAAIKNTRQETGICISPHPIQEENFFLYHKTTYRPWYAEGMKEIKKERVFDVLYCNTKGELTEGARSNFFIEKKGMLYTPPIACGLLPGILRERLIRSKKCKEKRLKMRDIVSADALFCGNSVRGLIRVKLHKDK